MRIAVLVLGLILGAFMFFQTFLVTALSGATSDKATGGAGAVGLLMALLWLVACAVVIPLPLFSTVIFTIAGVLGFAAASSSKFVDLAYWGGASIVLAVLGLIGWFGKRRGERQEAARHAELVAAVRSDRTAS